MRRGDRVLVNTYGQPFLAILTDLYTQEWTCLQESIDKPYFVVRLADLIPITALSQLELVIYGAE